MKLDFDGWVVGHLIFYGPLELNPIKKLKQTNQRYHTKRPLHILQTTDSFNSLQQLLAE